MKSDPHSFANFDDASVTHLHWKAHVDFEKKVISGTASWTISHRGIDRLILDTKGLIIHKITLDSSADAATYRVEKPDPVLGAPLVVSIKPDSKTVHIQYETGPDAAALQWLTPQQTSGRIFPFLFTQSQAILARSWIPCQDSPGVRFTYEADVSVPPELLPLMSASNPIRKNATGRYHFKMEQPIPSYLLALAVGDVDFKPISNRSGVYAEANILERATWEFADLEKMIAGAEALYGSYKWERYDVLVLPPSFPFGGMENPRLTFATPTILAGDRSLTSLIAHELAHSWSGNLVTNATWNDFWLNEGFTVYFETRIMEKLYGTDYAEMLAALNLQDLREEIRTMTEKGNAADTRLRLNLDGRNPDEGVTSIAYNKGYYFLRTIEGRYGREMFDRFVRDYFAHHAFRSIDTDAFVNYIQKYYNENYSIRIDDQLFSDWIEGEGLPGEVPVPRATRFEKVDRFLDDWISGKNTDPEQTRNWSTHEWLHFIRKLPHILSEEQLEALEKLGHFTASGNAEVIAEWGVAAIRNGYLRMYSVIENFLIHTGRRKFLVPLYEEMLKTPEGKKRAKTIYEKARPNYHFVATHTLDRLLNQTT